VKSVDIYQRFGGMCSLHSYGRILR
jgi:hypothetical protein